MTLCSVWTKDDSATWLRRNAGCTDRMVAYGMDEGAANSLAATLRDKYGDSNVEVHPAHRPPLAGSVGTNHG